jgi:hypothetical protein
VREREFCFEFLTYFFTLVTTGDADGFAHVQFLLDGVVRANQTYFVPAGNSVQESFDLDPNDCFTHAASLRIASVWKGQV